MKVLFISSGNKGISPIIRAQGESLRKAGIQIEYLPIVGKGIWGYLSNVPAVRKRFSKGGFDLVHAHYSLCGFVAALANLSTPKKKKKPIVMSLMGSDVKDGDFWLSIIRHFVKHVWDVTIVKSDDMKNSLGIDSVYVIPNGVDIELCRPLDQENCRREIGWDLGKKYVLFGADPAREVKNFPLTQSAFSQLALENVELKTLGQVPHDEIPLYLNACDVLLLTSKWEGSPNIIKEAMACNIPIVCTDVGDVRWLLEGVDGCYLTSHDVDDIAGKIMLALDFGERTNARERLVKLQLDAESVVEKIVNLYKSVITTESVLSDE